MVSAMDIVTTHSEEVDKTIAMHRQMNQLKNLVEDSKSFFRAVAAKIIGVEETSIKFEGTLGTIRVSFKQGKDVKFKKKNSKDKYTAEDVPVELRRKFFKVVSKYETVDDFEELVEKYPDILKYVELVDPTASVVIP